MARVVGRVRAGLNTTIVTIGGSVAMGAGALHGRGNLLGEPSTSRFIKWLRSRFAPGTHVTFANLAVPGTTTASRTTGLGLQTVAAARPHLVLWDYSANDYSRTLFSPAGYRAVLEHNRGLLVRSVELLGGSSGARACCGVMSGGERMERAK